LSAESLASGGKLGVRRKAWHPAESLASGAKLGIRADLGVRQKSLASGAELGDYPVGGQADRQIVVSIR